MDAFKYSSKVTFTNGDSSTYTLSGLDDCFRVCLCRGIAESITICCLEYRGKKERTNEMFPRTVHTTRNAAAGGMQIRLYRSAPPQSLSVDIHLNVKA